MKADNIARQLPEAKTHIIDSINSCTNYIQLGNAATCIYLFYILFEKSITKEAMKLHVEELNLAWTNMHDVIRRYPKINNDHNPQ